LCRVKREGWCSLLYEDARIRIRGKVFALPPSLSGFNNNGKKRVLIFRVVRRVE